MTRRAILRNALVFLWRAFDFAAVKPDAATMYAKVEEADSANGTASLRLATCPNAIWLTLHGDVAGLAAQDWVQFHLGENEISVDKVQSVDWKGKKIKLVGIVLRP